MQAQAAWAQYGPHEVPQARQGAVRALLWKFRAPVSWMQEATRMLQLIPIPLNICAPCSKAHSKTLEGYCKLHSFFSDLVSPWAKRMRRRAES